MTLYHLRDESGVEVFTGTITPAPGGGSQPGFQQFTFAAAAISARWDGDDSVAEMPLAGITDTMGVISVGELSNTLDQSVTLVAVDSWDPGADSAAVYNGGTAVVATGAGFGDANRVGVGVPVSTSWNIAALVSGKAAYARFHGDAAPTTGDVTIIVFTTGA